MCSGIIYTSVAVFLGEIDCQSFKITNKSDFQAISSCDTGKAALSKNRDSIDRFYGYKSKDFLFQQKGVKICEEIANMSGLKLLWLMFVEKSCSNLQFHDDTKHLLYIKSPFLSLKCPLIHPFYELVCTLYNVYYGISIETI